MVKIGNENETTNIWDIYNYSMHNERLESFYMNYIYIYIYIYIYKWWRKNNLCQMKYIYLEFWIRQFITKSSKKTSGMDTTRYCIGIVHQYSFRFKYWTQIKQNLELLISLRIIKNETIVDNILENSLSNILKTYETKTKIILMKFFLWIWYYKRLWIRNVLIMKCKNRNFIYQQKKIQNQLTMFNIM
jgi:hypothetical protein